MKYLKIFLAFFLIAGIFITVNLKPQKVTRTAFLLDTYITVTAYGKNAENAVDKAIERVAEIDGLLSCFNPESEIFRLNENSYLKVSPETFDLISRAVELSKKTDGAFDITVKPIMDLWGFGSENQSTPEEDKLKEKLALVDYKNIILDKKENSVSFKNKGMKIDLGGIAKGYAADCTAKVLKENGAENAYLDFGGNVVTIGKMPKGFLGFEKTRSFVIGIQDPLKERGKIFEKVTASGKKCAVVTSGGYERYFEENGEKYHHIIDPKTGKQPENEILSVTVVSDSSETADALSTAFFVSGEDFAKTKKELFKEVIIYKTSGEIIKITGEK